MQKIVVLQLFFRLRFIELQPSNFISIKSKTLLLAMLLFLRPFHAFKMRNIVYISEMFAMCKEIMLRRILILKQSNDLQLGEIKDF